MSLRLRLTLALVTLAAIGLGVAGIATYRALRSFEYDRIDDQLEAATSAPRFGLGPGGRVRGPDMPPDSYLSATGPDGIGIETGDVPAPDLPTDPAEGTYTVPAVDDSTRYRVRVVSGPRGTLVVGYSLEDVDDTLRRLLVIELIVSGVVLVALAGVGWWFVHLGLRPLEHMGDTAGKIAAGDLSQRVESTDPKTEVGRLGASLNTMLTRIEEAFAEREASEARLRRFVADASHELRTPLTSIRGYAELFRRGAGERPEDLGKSMRRIEEEAARMGDLVDDLLLLARLDQGRPLARERVDLAVLVGDAVDDARAVHPERAITADTNGALNVTGDEPRLRQVLGNLLANACTHTPPGSPVQVTLRQEDREAIIEVTDEGPGLRTEQLPHLFERFWRADQSRTRASGGVGLGLSIVDAIVRAHTGRVEVDTEPGRGTTFRVRLPIDAPSSTAAT